MMITMIIITITLIIIIIINTNDHLGDNEEAIFKLRGCNSAEKKRIVLRFEDTWSSAGSIFDYLFIVHPRDKMYVHDKTYVHNIIRDTSIVRRRVRDRRRFLSIFSDYFFSSIRSFLVSCCCCCY